MFARKSLFRSSALLVCVLLAGFGVASAIEVRVTAPALERTLQRQVFNQPDAEGKLNRHYLRGSSTKGCSVYVDDPHVTFADDRLVVKVKTHAKLGFGKACFGISVSTDSEVSFIPEAEGESVGFRDARIDHLSDNKELNLLLEPFLSKKLPQEMKINAADQLRQVISTSSQTTGYTLTLDDMKIHSMQVNNGALVVDFDGTLSVK